MPTLNLGSYLNAEIYNLKICFKPKQPEVELVLTLHKQGKIGDEIASLTDLLTAISSKNSKIIFPPLLSAPFEIILNGSELQVEHQVTSADVGYTFELNPSDIPEELLAKSGEPHSTVLYNLRNSKHYLEKIEISDHTYKIYITKPTKAKPKELQPLPLQEQSP